MGLRGSLVMGLREMLVMGLRGGGLCFGLGGAALHPSYGCRMGVARDGRQKNEAGNAQTHHACRTAINQVPAIAICSIKIEPVVFVPREMVSAPTATICWNMSARLPAMVISWTACWILPFSTQ